MASTFSQRQAALAEATQLSASLYQTAERAESELRGLPARIDAAIAQFAPFLADAQSAADEADAPASVVAQAETATAIRDDGLALKALAQGMIAKLDAE